MRFALVFGLLLCCASINAQSAYQQFKKLSGAEKWWALTHPFAIKKARRATQEALRATDSLYRLNVLDQHTNGGKIDAFRHGYWMALLTRSIGQRKALSLGRAHERGNKRDFKKKRLEEGLLPDSVSMEMDLHNNWMGSEISLRFPSANRVKMMEAIQFSVLKDKKFLIVKRNQKGEFLDENDAVIPTHEWLGRWVNDRCLVPSHYPYP